MRAVYHPLIYLAIGGFCLSVMSLLVWVHTNGSVDNFTAGQITSVATSSFFVSDRRDGDVQVLVTPDTQMWQGHDAVSFTAVAAGGFVQVQGVVAADGVVTANTIRLMRSPQRDNNESDYETH